MNVRRSILTRFLGLLLAFGVLAGRSAPAQEGIKEDLDRAEAAVERLDFAGAEERFAAALARAVEQSPSDALLLAGIERRLATVQSLRGRPEAALATLDSAVLRLDGAGDAGAKEERRSRLFETLVEAARQLHKLGRHRLAAERLTRAEGLLDETDARNETALLGARDQLSREALECGDLEGLLGAATRHLRLLEKAKGPTDPDLVLPLKRMVQALRGLGRPKQAIPTIERWIAIHEKLRGPDHPGIVEALDPLVACRLADGDHEGALATLVRWEAILDRVMAGHPGLVTTQTWRGRVETARGRTAEALAAHDAALASAIRAHGKKDAAVARCALELAAAARRAKDLAKARSAAELARDILSSRGPRDLEFLKARIECLRVIFEQEGADAALPGSEAMVADCEKVFGREEAVLEEPLLLLAELRRAQGREDDAKALEARARGLRARPAGSPAK